MSGWEDGGSLVCHRERIRGSHDLVGMHGVVFHCEQTR